MKDAYSQPIDRVFEALNSSPETGLNTRDLDAARAKYGKNTLRE